MTVLEGRARLGPMAWLKTASVAAAMTMALASSAWADGTFRFAMTDDPPHLDVHVTTASLTSNVAMHILETLYTFNSKLEPVPLLAEGETISDDGKTVVITLRSGVPFHNGKEMTAEDVKASLDRWGEPTAAAARCCTITSRASRRPAIMRSRSPSRTCSVPGRT